MFAATAALAGGAQALTPAPAAAFQAECFDLIFVTACTNSPPTGGDDSSSDDNSSSTGDDSPSNGGLPPFIPFKRFPYSRIPDISTSDIGSTDGGAGTSPEDYYALQKELEFKYAVCAATMRRVEATRDAIDMGVYDRAKDPKALQKNVKRLTNVWKRFDCGDLYDLAPPR